MVEKCNYQRKALLVFQEATLFDESILLFILSAKRFIKHGTGSISICMLYGRA